MLPCYLIASPHHFLALTLKIDPGGYSCRSELQTCINAVGRREIESTLRGSWTNEEREVLQAMAMALKGEQVAALRSVQAVRARGSALARTCAWIASWTWLGQDISAVEWTRAQSCAVEDYRSSYLLLEFLTLLYFKAAEWRSAYYLLLQLLSELPDTEFLEVLVLKLMIWKCCCELHYQLGAETACRDVAILRSMTDSLPAHLAELCEYARLYLAGSNSSLAR